MDERHWWIAQKIQETFRIGGYENPAILEDFMCQQDILEMVNQFLAPKGPGRIFFYCNKSESGGSLTTQHLNVANSLTVLKDANLDEVTVIYFLRQETSGHVDSNTPEREIFCGDLKNNAIENLTALLSEIYIPIIKAQREWGECTEENKMHLMYNMEKFLTSLSETSATAHSANQWMLKHPEHLVSNDFKQHRLAALDHHIILEYENLVNDWISTIEAILTDTSDERFLDPNAGPLSELDRWRRRQRLLASITEQLKGKECKAVIGVLISAKSRLLKKWKSIDAGITDAMNETKDKVKYLESLKRHLDQLYHSATPSSIASTALPGLVNSIKQMDSISRFYSRAGFLGLLFSKVTNQLVLACKDHIKECTINKDDVDNLWMRVDEEIQFRDQRDSADPQHKQLRTEVISRIKPRAKGKDAKEAAMQDETLYGRLKACLSLQSYYREALRSMRDSLGASLQLTHYPSVSSVAGQGPGSIGSQKLRAPSLRGGPSPSKRGSSIAGHNEGHGVSLADEETILGHMDAFCNRIRQIMDVINTLSQYHRVIKTTNGLPRPRQEDLVCDESMDETDYKIHNDNNVDQQVALPSRPDPGNLGAIAEDEEMVTDQQQGGDSGEGNRDALSEYADEIHDLTNPNHGLTKQHVTLLKEYYPDDSQEEGPSVTNVLRDHCHKMGQIMLDNVTTKTSLDVESKDKDKFDDIYTSFLTTVQEMEKFVQAYLHAVFMRKMKTHEGLDLITRFVPIQHRPGVRAVVAEKFVEIFTWYESDIDEVHKMYESNKEDPPMLRNAPPVAGAIHWSRQLMKRIEDPMKVFRDNRAITNLKDFSRIVRMYNRLATALVTFESLWFSQWKSHIEHAREGLRATLFVHHPETKIIVVNADDRVLQLIHEARWLKRLSIQIPESAESVLQQESRFKNYKNHLELVLSEYKALCESVPISLQSLFDPHVQAVAQNFQPGLTTLAWNSMNIDAFLHQIHSGTSKLRQLVERVNEVVSSKVEGTIDKIKDMIFFDYQLAFSKQWPPEDFCDAVWRTVEKKAVELNSYMVTIETGIHDICNMLTFRKGYSFSALKAVRGVVKFRKKLTESKAAREEAAASAMSDYQMYGSSFSYSGKSRRAQTGSQDDKPNSAIPTAEDNLTTELLSFYTELVYEAILSATYRSLVTLAESSGCEGELVRAVSVMSGGSSQVTGGGGSVRSVSPWVSSSSPVKERPVSSLSMLSTMTWTTEKTQEVTYLQFEVFVKFSIPNIVIEPALDSVQKALNHVTAAVLGVTKDVAWLSGERIGETFLSRIAEDDTIQDLVSQIHSVVDDLQPIIKQHIRHFSMYNFLWKDDMRGNYYEFIGHDPGTLTIKREVERLLKVEQKVLAIPSHLPVGPIVLLTDPIRNALHGFAMAWKTQYASVLHEEAKKKLDAAVLYRSNVRNRLEVTVSNLDQLNSTLHLLEELRDMENKIDDIYLPIENLYTKLREFELRLPRHEVQEVDSLRDRWEELLTLAEDVRQVLLKEKRGAFEQELDKQVKTFVVEVIQFRNAFDAQGPAVPGIPPEEAVTRLHDFQQRYTLYEAKRKTLDSVSRLFGIICKPFPELDKTGEELDLLGQLYGLYQKFIRFDQIFRDSLWADVDLNSATQEVESYWDECLALPSKLKDWDAYNDLKGSIQQYLDIIPLLHRLALKEIRNRHWLQVMQVTGSSFQLEANIFKLMHLLDIGLIKHKVEIEEICRNASREQELEIKMRITEEEWTEQVLTFENYKKRGPIYLDKASTERLLEQLEDAQALLAQMLTSRHIGPLREEAASWAEKLKEVAQVLETWLEVQDLWQYLEAVFSNSVAAKELPQEAKRFSRIDKGWTKMMTKAYDTRNVLQSCYGGEVPRGIVLRHIYEELEICFKSLVGYLDNKRRAFPRFYFVSDSILLAMLSRPKDLESVRPHLRCIFTNVMDVKLEQAHISPSPAYMDRYAVGRSHTPGYASFTPSDTRERLLSAGSPSRMSSHTPTRIDKRLSTVHNMEPSRLSHRQSLLPSERAEFMEERGMLEAVAVHSVEGEFLQLDESVSLEDGTEVWLRNLKDSITATVQSMLKKVIEDCNSGLPVDEWAAKYPAQVCRIGLLYYWTKEGEQAVTDIKYDRKAIHNTIRRFGATVGKLPTCLVRGAWRNRDDQLQPVHRLRLENMITYSLFLRDVFEQMNGRRIREPTDFDWRRNVRCYLQEHKDELTPLIYILDQSFVYGGEFHGAQPVIGLTPLTDRCFLTMSMAMGYSKGSMLTGPTGVGKTETVKGLAQLLGRHLVTHQCSPQADPAALGKLMQGLAMDGCWGCFDELQLIRREAVAVLLEHVQAIQSALRADQDYCMVGDGQELRVLKDVNFFVTYNPSTAPPGFQLPSEMRAMFRVVSLVRPDTTQILKAKCSSLGFKAPGVLATRLKIISDLAKDELPPSLHCQFSVASLSGVLARAGQKRKIIKDDKSVERMERANEKLARDEASRSNSQASMAAMTIGSTSNLISPTPGDRGKGGTAVQGNRKPGTPQPMSATAKMEHSIVGQTIMEMIGPRLSGSSLNILRLIIRDVFTGLPDALNTKNMSARSRTFDVEAAVHQTATSHGLIAHKTWVEKCMQLYHMSSVHQGMIIAGPPGSGKSQCIQTLVDALCVTPRGLSRHSQRSTPANTAETNHKLQKINPLVVDDSSLMFGYLNHNHDWVEGIFTSAWRKANRNQSTTWLCLDGPLNAGWADNFSSVLDGDKVLHLRNGDRLFLSENVKILFETDNLELASPATVCRAGIIYMDQNVLGWRPIAKAWLENRTQMEVHVLQRAFDKTVDAISHFVINDARPRVQLDEVGMFQTCINLVSAMLADNIEIGGELHIERLYLFCLIWTYGGLLDDKEKKAFSDLLKTLSTALPDDDRDINVFDYYVDESGEWDPWQSRVPEAVYSDNLNLLGEVLVDTVDTIRTRILMEFAAASGQNVLLVGPPGSGKTAMINDFINMQDPQQQVSKRLVFSGASTAKQLQLFIEANIYHRQGFVYGAKDNKRLQLFIDDINLPKHDEHNVQRVNELLRQMVDDKVLCTLEKPFEWRTIEGLMICSAMSLSDSPSVTNRTIGNRLLRHFAVFCLPQPQDEALKSVVNGILDVNMGLSEKPAVDIDLHNSIVSASCKLLVSVQKVLRISPMPGRRHYLFTLRDIVTCFQCLKRLPSESRADNNMVISLWRHEMTRIMKDRICRQADMNWFDDGLTSVLNEVWPDMEGKVYDHFVTFPTDARAYQRPVTSLSKKEVRVVLQPIEEIKEVHNCLMTHMTRYNEEFGNIQLNLMLSEHVISHVIRLHRVLSFQHGGNFLLVGAIGSHLETLCKLALHVAELPIHKIETHKSNSFFDGLRSAVRLSGSEGKSLTLMFNGDDLHDDSYLDAINSLLVCGEYPHLFTNDEMDGLLQAIGPALKREHPTKTGIDPMKFFVSRIRSNLHIVICLPPNHRLLRAAFSEYPGLLKGCQLCWVCDWAPDTLLGEAQYYVQRNHLASDCDADLSEAVSACLANIHSFVLRDCKQTPWAGELSEQVHMTQVAVNERRKELIRVKTLKLPNLPYSKLIMHEHIKNHHRNIDVPAKNELFVGPHTYKRFMDCLRYTYTLKAKRRTQTVCRLKKVLATLDQSRADAKNMRQSIKDIHKKFEEAKVMTAGLLTRLTSKATLLEKLKAQVGMGSALSAFLQLNELSSDEEEDDSLLNGEENDEYDVEFDRMREANLKTRVVQAKEEYGDAEKRVEVCRKELGYAKDQVLIWKNRVDRQCVERLKSFTNPSQTVLQVMEMVMTLIGKHRVKPRGEEKEIYPRGEEMSGRMSSSSSSTRVSKRGMRGSSKEKTDKELRQQWKIMLLTLNDAGKFVDMMHNVAWEEGLDKHVLEAVESYLAQGKDGELGVTGEGTLLDNAQDRSFKAEKRSHSPDHDTGITISAAKYSSEDCSTLVQYTIAIVEYTRRCGPLKAALERLHELQREIEENERLQREKELEKLTGVERPQPEAVEEEAEKEEEEEVLTEDDLPRIQQLVDGLQTEFDAAVVVKHSLEMELASMQERLKAATGMIDSLRGQEKEWRHHVEENSCNEVLLANCITASAFLTYCGSMNTDTRQRMGEFFMYVCEHHGIPLPNKQLFRNMELIEFLYQPIEVKELEILELPMTRLMLENTCFMLQEEGSTAWPLICDPNSRVSSWIRSYLKDTELVQIKYHELRSHLETSLSDGTSLLVMDCDVKALATDDRFINVILNRQRFISGTTAFKIMVGDHEVECQPQFRMYLHTTTDPHLVPHSLAAYVSVMYFQESRQDVEEELLDIFMAMEKSRLEDEKVTLRKEKIENMKFLAEIEDQMLECLSRSEVRLMNDLNTTKQLAELKKQYNETLESQTRVESSEGTIKRAREGYRSISSRGAVCFDVAQYMREINPLYQTSFQAFLDIFTAAIAHSERASVKAVVERLTQSAYLTTARSLLEKDKTIYTLLLAIEIEDSLGNVGVGEREFLVSPALGSATMTALGIASPPDSKISQTKKPFDWMLDDQYNNLLILANHYEWFQEMFDRMPRDGRETQWRNLCEHEYPENAVLPDKSDEHFNALQRFLILRSLRPDRMMQMSTAFISSVLGKKYVGDVSLDIGLLLKQSSGTTPLLLMYAKEPEAAEKMFREFASKKQCKSMVLNLSDYGPTEEKMARKMLQHAAKEGQWLLLSNAHNAIGLLNNLESVLLDLQQVEPLFRCWITAKATSSLPVRTLQTAIKVIIDSPKVMKDNLVKSFGWLDADVVKQSSRPEWPAVLHNLCYLHGALRLRARFGRGGWNSPLDFLSTGNSDLHEVLNLAASEFKDDLTTVGPDGSLIPRNTSWNGLRFMITEIVYCSYATDLYDQTSLSSMVDYWISPNAVKRDFEVPRLKYRLPGAFFSNYVRLSAIQQALEGLGNHFLDVPEACNLHSSSEALLGDDQYVYTRLNKVFDAMPSTSSLAHKLFPRPPTPYDGPSAAMVSGPTNPVIASMGVFASASFALTKMKKEVELWEVCHTMIPKVPRAYSKEYIAERVKKIGGFTVFNNFIMRELDQMFKLLIDIKTTLQQIKCAVEVPSLGDQLSERILDAADDLYHLRIPRVWCQMAGSTAPPASMPLANWLTDLQNRVQHFERILVLGREKMPAYWLGAFFHPQGLLALLKQEAYRHSSDRTGYLEPYVFQTEITARDKDHLRDPPQEGMFIHGVYIWGCAWEKTTGELVDAPPKHTCVNLPVIHITCWPQSEKPILQDPVRSAEWYSCPVYQSRLCAREPVFELDVGHVNIPATRWALRGLSATIRPF